LENPASATETPNNYITFNAINQPKTHPVLPPIPEGGRFHEPPWLNGWFGTCFVGSPPKKKDWCGEPHQSFSRGYGNKPAD
jgi:hypothetical protein